jgi:site-specific DNA recombinase
MVSVAQKPHPGISPRAKTAAIYVRVSSARQELGGASLETQEAAARAFATEHNLEVVRLYREVHTATQLVERPQLSALREAARAREFDAVIFHSVDRLSRNQAHLAIVIDELRRAGVEYLFTTEDFDESPVGKFILAAKAFAAELDIERHRERVIRGKQAALRAGRPLKGGYQLYGYRWEGKAHMPDEVTAPIVRWMFEQCAAGKTLRAIGDDLTARGVPPPNSPRWNYATIGNFLRNPTYAGRATGNRWMRVPKEGPGKPKVTLRPAEEQVPIAIPALVSEGLFAAVQDRLDANRCFAKRNNRNAEAYLLRSGFLRCGYCGRVMAATMSAKRDGQVPYYVCKGASAYAGQCGRHGIVAHKLDNAVWARCVEILTQPDIIARELTRQREEPEGDPTAEAGEIERKLRALSRQQANIARSIARLDERDAAPLEEELARLGADRRALESRLSEIGARRERAHAAEARLMDLEAWRRTVASRLESPTYELRREILAALEATVTLWRADHTPRYEIGLSVPLLDEGVVSGSLS